MKRTLAVLGVLVCAMTITTGLLMWGEPDPIAHGAPLQTAAAPAPTP